MRTCACVCVCSSYLWGGGRDNECWVPLPCDGRVCRLMCGEGTREKRRGTYIARKEWLLLLCSLSTGIGDDGDVYTRVRECKQPHAHIHVRVDRNAAPKRRAAAMRMFILEQYMREHTHTHTQRIGVGAEESWGSRWPSAQPRAIALPLPLNIFRTYTRNDETSFRNYTCPCSTRDVQGSVLHAAPSAPRLLPALWFPPLRHWWRLEWGMITLDGLAPFADVPQVREPQLLSDCEPLVL